MTTQPGEAPRTPDKALGADAPPLSSRLWRYTRGLLGPLLVCVLLGAALLDPVRAWLRGPEHYDEEALREWLRETRNPDRTLAELVAEYVKATELCAAAQGRARKPSSPEEFVEPSAQLARNRVVVRRTEIEEHMRAMAEPATKMHPRQLLLFPIVYRFEIRFHFDDLPATRRERLGEGGPRMDDPIVWESGLSVGGAPLAPDASGAATQFRRLRLELNDRATAVLLYQLHAFDTRQQIEQEQRRRLLQLTPLALAALVLGVAWMLRAVNREREQEHDRLQALRQAYQAEQQLAAQERLHAETERQLLEQRLATQAAERQALELKSNLYASIGVMAGSYAHNIKNLLVRPNDLLRRCLESGETPPDQQRMIREIQQTLGTVTERLQQILHTIRSDPEHVAHQPLDLNQVVQTLATTWRELAADRWQVDLELDLAAEPLPIQGDVSHLQQAAENLLFNARDATFEMRNTLRDAARRGEGDATARRRALIEAASWRGRVELRTRRVGEEVILEVSDNGAGMSEEVRQHCTETHFSTKRGNALYQGHSTGMGLGLSFVVAILEHHRASLEIDSKPLQGTTFRVRFAGKEELGAS